MDLYKAQLLKAYGPISKPGVNTFFRIIRQTLSFILPQFLLPLLHCPPLLFAGNNYKIRSLSKYSSHRSQPRRLFVSSEKLVDFVTIFCISAYLLICPWMKYHSQQMSSLLFLLFSFYFPKVSAPTRLSYWKPFRMKVFYLLAIFHVCDQLIC